MDHRTSCGCFKDIGSSRCHIPHYCDHGNLFLYTKPLKKSGRPSSSPQKQGGLKRTQRRESAAERKAREHFNETVKSWPCWFLASRPCERCSGLAYVLGNDGTSHGVALNCPDCFGTGRHACSGEKDAHHLIPKQFIRQRCSDWSDADLLALLFNPLIGAPLCRKAHDAITAKTDRIYWQDLNPETIEYVSSLPDFLLLRLELESPKRPVKIEAASPSPKQPANTVEGGV